MGATAPSCFVERRRHFGDAKADKRCLDHHLRGEFHPRGLQIEAVECFTRQGSQPTMEITGRRMEEQPADRRQHGIAQVPVHPRHRAGSNATEEAVPHHEVRPFPHFLDERIKPREVVAVVGVAHDDVAAARFEKSVIQRGTIAAHWHIDDAGPCVQRNALRSVSGSVVCDQDFGDQPEAVDAGARFSDAGLERLSLVQARHEHGDLETGGTRRRDRSRLDGALR